jgi:hypothetical protein
MLKEEKEYRGFRQGRHTVVEVRTIWAPGRFLSLPLKLRLDLWRHAECFDWGDGGAGAAQLALAILADLVGDRLAIRLHQGFKWQRIAELSRRWLLKQSDVMDWLNAQKWETADVACQATGSLVDAEDKG